MNNVPNRPLRVALLDNDDSVRNALARLLRSLGLKAETFASAPEFLQTLPDHLPDCLLLDLTMPGLNGHEVQDRIHARGVHLPVIVVTADPDADPHQAMAAGACAFLRKPFDDAQLLAALSCVSLPFARFCAKRTRQSRHDRPA